MDGPGITYNREHISRIIIRYPGGKDFRGNEVKQSIGHIYVNKYQEEDIRKLLSAYIEEEK